MLGIEISRVEFPQGCGEGFTMPLGAGSIVALSLGRGMIGCGVFDLNVLERLGIPAAKVTGVTNVQELLDGTVREVNPTAVRLGVREEQSGREAAELLLAGTTAQPI